jgi:hypothetical protein
LLCPFVFACFCLYAQCCHFCLPNLFHICFRAFTGLSQISRLTCLGHSPIMYPKPECVRPYKTVLDILVQITGFTYSLGLWVFPWKHFFRRSTRAKSVRTGLITSITTASKEYLCSYANLNWHRTWIYNNCHHHLGKHHAGVYHLLATHEKVPHTANFMTSKLLTFLLMAKPS